MEESVDNARDVEIDVVLCAEFDLLDAATRPQAEKMAVGFHSWIGTVCTCERRLPFRYRR